MTNKVFVGFIILTAILSLALIYTYFVRRSAVSEGFFVDDISELESANIANTLSIIKRLTSKILNPSFFTNAYRLSTMSPVEMAREHIKNQTQTQAQNSMEK